MCQLFALNSNVPTSVTFSLTGLAARGGRTDEHADGWGVAFHHEGAVQVFRDERPACTSPLAAFLCRHPIRAGTVVAHIRKATQGAVELSNCHPFRRLWAGRTWSFAHNGNLADYAPSLPPDLRPRGSTDSERALGALIRLLRLRFGDSPNRSGDYPPTPIPVLAPLIAEWAADVARHGPFNFIFTDGQALYAHCSTKLHLLQRSHPFGRVRLCDAELSLDLSEANGPDDRMSLVATEPLTVDEPWQALQPGEFVALERGECVWRSAH